MLVDVNSTTCINSGKENNDKDSKFEFGDHITLSTYQKPFAKSYSPKCIGEFLVTEKVKMTVPLTYVIEDLKGKLIVGTFY